MRSGRDRLWPSAASGVALGLLLVDALRVWLPSILFVVGDAGETSALTLGAFALGCLAIAPAAGAATRVASPRLVWVLGWVTAIVGRLALQLTDGGGAQAGASTLAVIGAGVALAALAAGTEHPGTARVALLAGVTLSGAVHATLGTVDLLWRPGAGWAIASLAVTGACAWALARGSRHVAASEPAVTSVAWPWWALGPALALHLVLVLPAGRAAVALDADPARAAVTVTVLGASTVIAALVAGRLSRTVAAFSGATLTALGTSAALDLTRPASVRGAALLAIGIGLVVGRLPEAGTSGRGARGSAAGGALMVLGVLVLAHYASYDIQLPVPGRSALLAAALGLMASALVELRRPTEAVEPSGSLHGLVATGLVVVLLVVPASRLPSVAVAERTPDVAAIEVILANVHMGFDDRGRFTAPETARLLAAEGADVVVLNEVDRGWLTTGSHDVGRVLEVGSGLRMVFAPAADDVWGNAILTHLPVSEVVVERLPRGRDAMWRSVLVVVLDLPDGGQVAVVATHLSHVDDQGDTRLPQAQAVAGIVALMRERGLPVVVAGDLNADADGAELAAFAGLVIDAGPIGAATYPSSSPRVRIDHVLVSPEITVVRRRVMDARTSDHRFVQVTLDLSAPPA